MKTLIVTLFWLSMLAAYGVYRYTKRHPEKFQAWLDGFCDWIRGIDNEPENWAGHYRNGYRRAAEVGYYVGWAAYGLLCIVIIISYRWAFAQ